jgi:DNA-directed RNA polymerase specialized sigma24 family protein
VLRLDPESAGWLRTLAGTGPAWEAALGRLHEMLVRIARDEVGRGAPRLQLAGPELDDLAYQAAPDALIAITGKSGQFRGESRFTTWAYKFVIFEVSAKIGRHPDIPLDAEDWDRPASSPPPSGATVLRAGGASMSGGPVQVSGIWNGGWARSRATMSGDA